MQEQDSLLKIGYDHLLTLYQITRIINSSLDFDMVLQNVMDAVMQVTRAQRGFLMIADESSGKMEVRVARNPEGENLAANEAYSTTVVNQVVATRQPLLTNNAQSDAQFKGAASISLQKLRAILGAPMLLKDRLVGVIYVDTTIRSGVFVESDLHLLNTVAGQAAIAIDNARLYRLAVEKGRMERELQMAREIQLSLLPRSMPQLEGYELAGRWRSAREMAGDFYDAFLVNPETLCLVIADVSDKGAAAALCMASTRSMIRSYAFSGHPPERVLSLTNDLLVEDTESGMFVTAYCSFLQVGGNSLHVNAGHNPPMIFHRATSSIELMPRGGRALGWVPNNPLDIQELALERGDLIVYYTDGVTDVEDIYGNAFGESGLAHIIELHSSESPSQIIDAIERAVDEHSQGVPEELERDDLTVCVVHFVG